MLDRSFSPTTLCSEMKGWFGDGRLSTRPVSRVIELHYASPWGVSCPKPAAFSHWGPNFLTVLDFAHQSFVRQRELSTGAATQTAPAIHRSQKVNAPRRRLATPQSIQGGSLQGCLPLEESTSQHMQHRVGVGAVLGSRTCSQEVGCAMPLGPSRCLSVARRPWSSFRAKRQEGEAALKRLGSGAEENFDPIYSLSRTKPGALLNLVQVEGKRRGSMGMSCHKAGRIVEGGSSGATQIPGKQRARMGIR